MHIGYLTPEYPLEQLSRSGGLGTSIRNLAIELVKRNHNVTVFVSGQKTDANFNDLGINIISIAQKQHKALGWYLERKRIQKIVQNHIDEAKIDVIEAPDWTGLSAFMKFTVPLVIRLNGSDGYFCYLEQRQQKWKHRFLEHKALKQADAIVSASTFTGEVTKQLFKLKKSITTIHNSIDTEVFKPLKVEQDEHLLLYFGTIVRKKGVLELAKTFNLVINQFPKATLMLLGKDNIDVKEHVSTLQLFQAELTSEAQKALVVKSEIPYSEVKQYIAKARVVVLPSFAEAFPMTWLETLAMEKPLVSSNVGWAKELMVDGKTGYTVAQ